MDREELRNILRKVENIAQKVDRIKFKVNHMACKVDDVTMKAEDYRDTPEYDHGRLKKSRRFHLRCTFIARSLIARDASITYFHNHRGSEATIRLYR
jgi:hypothetical protein